MVTEMKVSIEHYDEVEGISLQVGRKEETEIREKIEGLSRRSNLLVNRNPRKKE